jgi:hypothetical protein
MAVMILPPGNFVIRLPSNADTTVSTNGCCDFSFVQGFNSIANMIYSYRLVHIARRAELPGL